MCTFRKVIAVLFLTTTILSVLDFCLEFILLNQDYLRNGPTLYQISFCDDLYDVNAHDLLQYHLSMMMMVCLF